MDYVSCPYDPEHKVHGTELRMHLMTCQRKNAPEKPASNQPTKKKTKWIALSLKKEAEEEQKRLERDIQVFGLGKQSPSHSVYPGSKAGFGIPHRHKSGPGQPSSPASRQGRGHLNPARPSAIPVSRHFGCQRLKRWTDCTSTGQYQPFASPLSVVDGFAVPLDPQNPDRLIPCPYDSNHQIRASRFPYHLIKCRKNHTDLANQLVTCPFNARHMITRGDLSFHISRCEDKSCIEQDIVDEKSMYKRDVSPSRWNSPPCDENWDNDLQTEPATFVWGTPSYQAPSTSTLMDPKNSLVSSLRAPKSLPYVLPWKISK
ncbi:uncharacterized protein LOC120993929 [Bufo bufo]|uniref:uncharacterized protein LOC120993929 n=1 Tax=Bufo bufo TaxID=8384 RepID=UPI001ABEB7F0|nr:uncharacterized protein LOC120993929 [Bufo bufo]